MAGQMGVRTFNAKVKPGESYTNPSSAIKGLAMMTFEGTSTVCLSFWLRNELAYDIYTHSYYSQGTIQDGKICLTKDSTSGNFIITNNLAAEQDVILKVVSI